MHLLTFAAHPPLLLHLSLFFFTAPPTTEIYTLSLHDALPISRSSRKAAHGRLTAPLMTCASCWPRCPGQQLAHRSEEHTSELQSRFDLVCRLLLEKKKKKKIYPQKYLTIKSKILYLLRHHHCH